MAESLKKLESEITCPLCLMVYTEPRKLPCDHVYCTRCLGRLAQIRKNNTISCPECSATAQIPDGQVNQFSTAFHINKMKDLYVEFTKTLRSTPMPATAQPITPPKNACKEHKTEPLVIYCNTCRKELCRDCVLATNTHKEHEYGYIEQIAKRVRREMDQLIEPLKALEMKSFEALKRVRERQAEIRSHGELLQTSIDVAFAEIITKLKEEKSTLETEAADKIREKLNKIEQQVEDIEHSQNQLQSTMTGIETAKQSATEPELIKSETSLREAVQKVQDDFESLKLSPCEVANLGVEISSAEDHGKIWRDNSYTYYLADPKKCTVTGSCLSQFEVNTQGAVEVNIMDSYRKPCLQSQSLHVTFKRARDDTAGTTQVSDKGAGLYEIAIQAASRGWYKLSIEINGSHVAESPYDILAVKPPQEISLPLKKINRLKSPSGLSCSNNKLIISNHDHDHLTVINSVGERSQMKLPAPLPTGATFDGDGNLYVCTAKDCKLHKFDKSGQRVKSTMTGQFKFPNGMVLSKENRLYVCDSNDDRIQVFDTELTYQHSITGKSVKSFAQCKPLDIDMDDDGRLYVVEHGNQRVEVLDSGGRHLLTIGARRSGSLLQGSLLGGQEKLSKPAGVKVFREYVYVADWDGNCVFVFTKDGRFVTTFGGDVLKQPEGLTIDEDGYIYVAHSRKEVVIF